MTRQKVPKKKDGMAAVWCCIIPLRKEFDSGLLVWGPVEGDKLLSLIHVYSLLSNKFSGYFFFFPPLHYYYLG